MWVIIYLFLKGWSLANDRRIAASGQPAERYNLRQPISRVIDIDIELSTVYFRRELLCSCDTKMVDDVDGGRSRIYLNFAPFVIAAQGKHLAGRRVNRVLTKWP